MRCDACNHWKTIQKTVYGDGSEIVHWKGASGDLDVRSGRCDVLGIETGEAFGCVSFAQATSEDDHAKIERKDGAPWQYFKMIPCPDCVGVKPGELYAHPAGNRGHRCAGTGLVRLYEDGHVGDEQTRLHPKQKEFDEAKRAAEELSRKAPDDDGRGGGVMGVP